MMHFRKKSSSSNGSDGHSGNSGHQPTVKLSKEDADRLKVRTASVADPILEAVNEAQPFEQAADAFQEGMNRKSYLSFDGSQPLRDIFGQPIHQPDISNPTRARDERPLDTIRGFEYAVSGDPSWSQQLETHQYGFKVRPDFPLFNANPYGMNGEPGMSQQPQMYSEQAVYQAPPPTTGEKKKKKKSFFSRKKKEKD